MNGLDVRLASTNTAAEVVAVRTTRWLDMEPVAAVRGKQVAKQLLVKLLACHY